MDIKLSQLKSRPSGRVFTSARSKGFTMVELIVTIIILGILAVVAGPKFFSTNKFEEMGFADVTANALRYGNKVALATGCDTRVVKTVIDSKTVIAAYQRDASGTTCQDTAAAFTQKVKPVVYVGDDSTHLKKEVPNGISLTDFDVYFDSKGKPYNYSSPPGSALASALTITVQASGSGSSRSVTIEPETGYVRQN